MSRQRWSELCALAKRGEATIDSLDSAIGEANAAGDDGSAFELRSSLIGVLHRQGQYDTAIERFSECLTDVDRLTNEQRKLLLFRYRLVLSGATNCPTIPRANVEQSLAQMEELYEGHGFSVRPVWVLRLLLAYRAWWDEVTMAEALGRYRRYPRDGLCDRQDTEATFVALATLRFGPESGALTACQMNIRVDIHRCDIQAGVLQSLLNLGELELAAKQHAEGWLLAEEDPQSFGARSAHALYLARIGQIERASDIVLADFDRAFASRDFAEKLEFFSYAAWILDRNDPNATLSPLRLTEDIVVSRRGELADWCRSEATRIAALYDNHNRAARATRFVNQIQQLAMV